MQTSVGTNMESLLREDRVFPPPAEFAAKAHIKSLAEYEALYRRSIEDPEAFWAEAASELEWFAPWTQVFGGDIAHPQWFTGGKLNLSHNCVDRHAAGPRRDKVALLWEGEPGEIRKLTFGELHIQVQRFANVLKGLGVKRGDRVAIYMGMTPELPIAILACARIGAVHSVIFGGFAAQAIVDRVNDSACVALLTQDISYRRGAEVKLKAIVDEAIERCPTVKNVVVYQRAASAQLTMKPGRDLWWHHLMAAAPPTAPPSPWTPKTRSTSSTPRAPPASQGPGPHHRWLLRRRLPHQQVHLRSARRRRLLVYRRLRLGHRPLLRRLRPAAERRHRAHVRGRPQLPRQRPLLADHR